MRFMVLVMANRHSEAGELPSTELMAAMGKFNEELVAAGVLLAGEGLHPTSRAARVKFSGTGRTVVPGPFTGEPNLVAGFWLWNCASMEEAVDWVKRCPNPHTGDSEIEIRRLYEAEDFGENFTPELRAQEDEMRARLEKKRRQE
jgi:hypothetical protein